MGVRLSEDALRGAVGSAVFDAARELFLAGAVGEITPVRGGASASVGSEPGGDLPGRDLPGRDLDVWVGVVDSELEAECGCGTGEGDDLCHHAVALALAAVDSGFTWRPVPAGDVPEIDPRVHGLQEAARRVPHDVLALIVAEFAVDDRPLEARLLVEAGELGPVSRAEAAGTLRSLDAVAQDATCGHWQRHDVVTAGEAIIETVETLGQRPASLPALRVVEHAARLWDGLAAHLFDDFAHFEGVPEEMGARMRRVHLRLCGSLDPDDLTDLAERLQEIAEAAEHVSCLDAPEEYAPFLA
jgi:hypothetical protein